MKKCGRCEEEKPLDSFGKHKGSKDGLNGTCSNCCSIIARSKSKNRPNVTEVSKEGEVWKKISEVFDWVDDTFLVSNLGRVYRQPYIDPQGGRWGGEECKIILRLGVPVVTVRDKNPTNSKTKKISVAFVYYKLFVNSNFEINDSFLPIYYFKDCNNMNIVDGNCIVTYSLENYPKILLEVYKYISTYFCDVTKSDFRFIGVRELSSLSEEVYFELEKKFNSDLGNMFYKFPKTGGGIERMISECMKKETGKTSGVVGFLKHHNIDLNRHYSNTKYMSNMGSICDSNIECFVRNIYEYLGYVDGGFEKKSLQELTNVNIIDYNPIPDEYFTVNGVNYISETFGFCGEDNDMITHEYNNNKSQKIKLYEEHGYTLISLNTHGKTYQDVLGDINMQLINLGLISNSISFNEEFYPKSYRYIMKDELLSFYKDYGKIFEPKVLKGKDKHLFVKLTKFCEMNNFTVTEYLACEIFKKDDITIARGIPSVKTYENHIQIINDVKEIVEKFNIKTQKGLKSKDNALYWRLYRMCESKGEYMSDFFMRELGINRKRITYTYDELYDMFKDCKNRFACQKKNDYQYRKAKKIGIIDIIFPTQ